MRNLPEYPFAALNRLIEVERRRGRQILSLAVGDPDGSPPEAVLDAVRSGLRDSRVHRYPSNWGTERLRNAVAAFYSARFGVELDPRTEVMPVLGAKEAVAHLCLALLEGGDTALAPEPGYPLYRVSPALAGADVVTLRLRKRTRSSPEFESLRGAVAGQRSMLFLNYPNNPTGAVIPPGGFERAVAFAAETGVVVVHDAAYTELAFDAPAPSFLATPGAREVGVEIFSLSKGWNLCGWRVGAILGNAEILERFHRLKSNYDQGMPNVSQIAAAAALEHAPGFPRLMAERYRCRAMELGAALAGSGLTGAVPAATPYLWLRGPAAMTGEEIAEQVLAQAGVFVMPGAAFGPSGSDYVRVSLTAEEQVLGPAIERLASVKLEV